MSNKQNDIIYDNMMDSADGLIELVHIVEKMLGRPLEMGEIHKLSTWQLERELALIEHCKKVAQKILTKHLTR